MRRTALSDTHAGFWPTDLFAATPSVDLVAEREISSGRHQIKFSELFYYTPGFARAGIRIFARLARPSDVPAAGLPGLVWVHGGGSIGSNEAVIDWASKGYAALSMDLPGKGGDSRSGSRSTGPDMSDDAVFTVTPSPENSYLFSCVGAVCGAVGLLAARPDINPRRIGLLGYSWGGVIVLLTNAVDTRVASVCTVFGSGFISDDSQWAERLRRTPSCQRDEWVRLFDPSSYLHCFRARTLFVSATADSYYPLNSFLRTWHGAACQKALSLSVNRNHELDAGAAAAINSWFQHTLQRGCQLPVPKVQPSGESLVVRSGAECLLESVLLHVADSADFRQAQWETHELPHDRNGWEVALPQGDRPWFVSCVDATGASRVVAISAAGISWRAGEGDENA